MDRTVANKGWMVPSIKNGWANADGLTGSGGDASGLENIDLGNSGGYDPNAGEAGGFGGGLGNLTSSGGNGGYGGLDILDINSWNWSQDTSQGGSAVSSIWDSVTASGGNNGAMTQLENLFGSKPSSYTPKTPTKTTQAKQNPAQEKSSNVLDKTLKGLSSIAGSIAHGVTGAKAATKTTNVKPSGGNTTAAGQAGAAAQTTSHTLLYIALGVLGLSVIGVVAYIKMKKK